MANALTTYRYRPMLRPAGFATLPSGLKWEFVEAPWDLAHIRTDLPRGDTRYGLIETERPLTADECDRFSLKYERFA